MKKKLFIVLFGFLLFSCNNNTEQVKTNAEEKNNIVIEKVVVNLDYENAEFEMLASIDSYQEITLSQTDDKCGEWGGNMEEIRIYQNPSDLRLNIDYKKTIIECNDAYSQKSQPEIIEKKGIKINNKLKKIISDCILELTIYKISSEQYPSHSGIFNSIRFKDSTLVIELWTSFPWPKYRELIKKVEEH